MNASSRSILFTVSYAEYAEMTWLHNNASFFATDRENFARVTAGRMDGKTAQYQSNGVWYNEPFNEKLTVIYRF